MDSPPNGHENSIEAGTNAAVAARLHLFTKRVARGPQPNAAAEAVMARAEADLERRLAALEDISPPV